MSEDFGLRKVKFMVNEFTINEVQMELDAESLFWEIYKMRKELDFLRNDNMHLTSFAREYKLMFEKYLEKPIIINLKGNENE